jgi:hypothetical protein
MTEAPRATVDNRDEEGLLDVATNGLLANGALDAVMLEDGKGGEDTVLATSSLAMASTERDTVGIMLDELL